MKPKKVWPVSHYSHSADKLLQQLFKLNYTKCIVCGNTMSCAHHYYPKSSAGNLRYNFLNLIPLCAGCHFKHHNGNPDIHNFVNFSYGESWLKQLQEAKKVPNPICNTKRYYEAKILELQDLIDNFI